MTERLFDKNSYIKEFSAKVLKVIACDGFYKIVLDKTAFFPESGGQNNDTGFLNNIPVFNVQEENGIIYHYTHSKISHEIVNGIINWDTRFNKMQNHTAEHIISGIVHNIYGYENTGFHLGNDVVTMDYNGPLQQEDIDKIEFLSNKAVWENHPVKAFYPDDPQAFSYRSKLDLKENIRLVEINNIDLCACCAPHVAFSGEIGFIKIVFWQKYKGGVRLFMKAGSFAYQEINTYFKALKKLSAIFSLPMEETPRGAEKLIKKHNETQYELNGLKAEVIKKQIETNNEKCVFVDSPELLKNAVNLLYKKHLSLTGAFCGNDLDGYRFNIITPDLEITKALLKEKLNVSGGGKDNMLQGKTNAKKEAIIEFFK